MADTQTRPHRAAARFVEASLNVLGYREEDEWVALAMEMDLRGYGDTFSEALEDLADLVQTQIDFAHFKNQPELIWRPAAPVWWARFAEAQRAALEAVARPPSNGQRDYEWRGMPIPLDRAGTEPTSFRLLDG
jgi:hypothetical protein